MESKEWHKGVMSKRTSWTTRRITYHVGMNQKGQSQTKPDVYTRPKLTSSLPPSVVTVDSTYPVSPLSDPENVSWHDRIRMSRLPKAMVISMEYVEGTGYPNAVPNTREDNANNQTLPSPSDKRPSTGHTVDLVAHHVLSSGMSTQSYSRWES